jgi:hypothetical protein
VAITHDSSSPSLEASFSNPQTSNHFSPPAGSTLVACVVDASAGGGHINTVSNSGTPLMWEEARSFGRVAIYTAFNASAQSNITVSYSTSGDPSDALILSVDVFNGVDSTNPVGNEDAGFSTTNFIQPNFYNASVEGSRTIYLANDAHGSGNPDVSGSPDVTKTWTLTSSSSSGLVAYQSANAHLGDAIQGYINGFGTASTSWDYVAVELIPSTSQTVSPTGIASGQAVGTPQINLTVKPSGIASGEALGTPALSLQNLILVQGIASGEAVGTPVLKYTQFVIPSGIESAETFGTLNIQVGYPQTVDIEGIPSEEALGDPQVSLLHRLVFRPPTVQEQPAARDILLIRYGIHRGITVIKRQDGTFYQTRFPDQATVEESARVYWGGHVNEISVEDALALIDAGYGQYISVEER